MHLLCTDLNFKRLSCRSHQSRMQRLVHIRFRHGDIVFESPRNRCVHLMDHTQRRITVFDRIYDNAYGKQIIHLIQRLILIDHLFVNAEEMLHSSIYFCLNMGILHMVRDLCHDLLHKLFPLCLSLV